VPHHCGVLATVLALAACGSDSNAVARNRRLRLGQLPSGSAQVGRLHGATERHQRVDQGLQSQVQRPRTSSTAAAARARRHGLHPGQGRLRRTDAALQRRQGRGCCSDEGMRLTGTRHPDGPGPVCGGVQGQGVTDLTLTPSLIAKIFTGKIKNWATRAEKATRTRACRRRDHAVLPLGPVGTTQTSRNT